MVSFTKTTKEKLENIFSDLGYKIRYEKGSFQSGYCLVQDQQVVVINKFFDLQGRIETLAEILKTISIDESKLESNKIKFLHGLLRELET